MNHNAMGNPQWLIPNGLIDAFPTFSLSAFVPELVPGSEIAAPGSSWSKPKFESLRKSRLPSRQIHEWMAVLAYLGNTENSPHLRSVGQVMDLLNRRFGRTDSERACSRQSSFAEFKRDGAATYKDFWTRFTRCATRLSSHGLAMGESVVFRRSIQDLRAPEGQLPILLAARGTFPNPTSIDSLQALTIKSMRPIWGKTDSPEVFNT